MADSALDWGRLGDPEYVASRFYARQLQDAAAFGLGVGQVERGPDERYLAEIEEMRGDLSAYMRNAWHVLEPNTPFAPNWHLDAIAEHLEAVSRGELKRLIINIPPRMLKTLSVGVFWMTWEWTWQPWVRWIFSSYAQDLSNDASTKARDLIQSDWYQRRWGHVYQLSGDQNVKRWFANNRRGFRFATSSKGIVTGFGGDRIVVDDPHNPRGAESEAERRETLDWWDQTLSTRLNQPTKGAKVIMMQRLHQHDLTGHVLARAHEGWEHLMLPMRFDPARRCVTSIGFADPRKKAGELLHPERMSEAVVDEQAADLGPYGVAGQHQQEPVARSGGQFERAWFAVVDEIPKGSKVVRVRHWDLAGTEGGGAYTCGTLVALRVTDGICYIEDVVRGQWAAGDRDRIILETAERDAQRLAVPVPGGNGTTEPNKLAVLYHVEQEPGSGGKDQARSIQRLLKGYRVETEPATGDKFTRADPLAGAAKAGSVKLVRGRWNEAFLAEMEAAGPGAAYLDQMDAASGAYNRAMKMWDRRTGTGLQGLRIELLDDDLSRESPARI